MLDKQAIAGRAIGSTGTDRPPAMASKTVMSAKHRHVEEFGDNMRVRVASRVSQIPAKTDAQ
jgi:hypothetical protein